MYTNNSYEKYYNYNQKSLPSYSFRCRWFCSYGEVISSLNKSENQPTAAGFFVLYLTKKGDRKCCETALCAFIGRLADCQAISEYSWDWTKNLSQPFMVVIAQSGRALPCEGNGCGFKSR